MTDLGNLPDRAKALVKLKGSTGWSALEEIYDEKKATYQEQIGKAVLRRGYEVNQREIDFNAGWFAGIKNLLDKPEKFEGMLEAALQKQRLQEQGEDK